LCPLWDAKAIPISLPQEEGATSGLVRWPDPDLPACRLFLSLNRRLIPRRNERDVLVTLALDLKTGKSKQMRRSW
jgi:hypothetical protein